MIFTDKMEVIESYQKSAPVKVVSLARDLGLEVYETEKGEWPESISGLIRRSGPDDEGFEIIVNGDHSFQRQRFTVAHEIAHFVLHKHKIGDGIEDDVLYRSGLSSRIESEANGLAADILMPWHLVDEKILAGEINIKKLAKIFQVSPASMSIRLGVPYDS